MGGNATVTNHKTQETFFAEKIPLQTIGRDTFIQTVQDFLVSLNDKFREQTGKELWEPSRIRSGAIFNGSTSYIMDTAYDSGEIESLRPYIGDIDVIVNRKLKKELYDFLLSLEGEEVREGVRYLGTNKYPFRPYMPQMNCVFCIAFKIPDVGELKIHCQVDFEFSELTESGEPTEFARFGHSSTIADARAGIKAFHHKYLLRALVGCLYTDPDGIVVLNGQRLDKPARTKIFNVDLGVCDQLRKISDGDRNVYQQLPIFKFKCVTDLSAIFRLCFSHEPDQEELDKMWTFVGLCELIRDCISKSVIRKVHRRYVDLLWASCPERGQELEKNSPESDLEVKLSGYRHFVKTLGLKTIHEPMISDYYVCYGEGRHGLTENFASFVAKKNCTEEDF